MVRRFNLFFSYFSCQALIHWFDGVQHNAFMHTLEITQKNFMHMFIYFCVILFVCFAFSQLSFTIHTIDSLLSSFTTQCQQLNAFFHCVSVHKTIESVSFWRFCHHWAYRNTHKKSGEREKLLMVCNNVSIVSQMGGERRFLKLKTFKIKMNATLDCFALIQKSINNEINGNKRSCKMFLPHCLGEVDMISDAIAILVFFIAF